MVEQDQDGALANAWEWKNKHEELNDAVHILMLLVLLCHTTMVQQDQYVFTESSTVETFQKLEECQLVEQNQDGALANAQEWKYKYEELNDTVHILSSLVLGHCTTRVKQD